MKIGIVAFLLANENFILIIEWTEMCHKWQKLSDDFTL